jgi:hypothetical protein
MYELQDGGLWLSPKYNPLPTCHRGCERLIEGLPVFIPADLSVLGMIKQYRCHTKNLNLNSLLVFGWRAFVGVL